MSATLSRTEYLILSLMSFWGKGTTMSRKQIIEELQIVTAYMDEATNGSDAVALGLQELIFQGYLFIGVVDGRVAFRPSGKKLSWEEAYEREDQTAEATAPLEHGSQIGNGGPEISAVDSPSGT